MAVAVAVIVGRSSRRRPSPVLNAPDGNTQSIAVKLTPQKLSKKKAEPVTLDVTTATTTTNPAPTKARRFRPSRRSSTSPKGTTIFSKGYPTCDAGLLQNTSTEAALEACKKAKIGGGKGTADLVGRRQNLPGDDDDHGLQRRALGRQAGDPAAHLQPVADPDDAGPGRRGEQPQQGRLRAAPRRTIPLIAGGQGAITGFHVKIFKTFRYKGKKRSYVSATCPTKKLKTRGKFVFKDGESLTPALTQKCAQKPK